MVETIHSNIQTTQDVQHQADSRMPRFDFSEVPKHEEVHLLETLHANEEVPKPEPKPEQNKKYDNPLDRFLNDANYRNISLGSINAVLHTLATITSFGSHDNKISWLKSINKIVDHAAFLCTRWIAPIISYGFAAYKALLNKEGFKALNKLIPPLFLPFVGDANIDTVYGLSCAINQPSDLAEDRIKFLVEQHPELAVHVKEANKTFSGNFKLMTGVLKQMLKEFIQGRMPKEEAVFFINCSLILAGSLPMLLFARHARDTTFAKVMGFIRNIGGILGDIGFFWFDRENMHKLMIGTMCTISAFSSIMKRWVKSDAVARTLIHLGAALDVSAYALWNAYNDKSQDKKGKTVKPEVVQTKLAQLADTKKIILATTAA